MCTPAVASGVGNAAVAVPFMTEKYEKSENCALVSARPPPLSLNFKSHTHTVHIHYAQELKFAKQTGVPIVPVMMQGGGWAAKGWLGLLTGSDTNISPRDE